ncbi:hypothetical protein NQ318_023331 [Aromia moschata]|uniref:PWWP domain-containing protein n=1 Tax=Aromia moschata TaxID=1265417 RepID=A0AAV8XTF6_9CUCU|nr:hypothetical protein NQ318_023331 [Aromia moschata]
MENKIKVNDLVWAKMIGFPPWPSLVVEPEPVVPEKPSSKDVAVKYYWIYFFGSHNYAWVEEHHLKPYAEFKEKFASLYKTVPFKEAVAEIEAIVLEIENDPDYQVPLEPFKKKEKISTKRKESYVNSSSKRLKPSYIETDESSTETESSTTPVFLSQFDSDHELLMTKDITTSDLKFGVLGIGIIGSGVVKNLVRSGHRVNMWNRTSSKCIDLQAELRSNGVRYVKSYLSPREVMERSDIVFNCVSDHNVSKKIIQNYFGINNSSDDILNEKGFVEMTGIDPETSKDIRDMIEKKADGTWKRSYRGANWK